MVAGAWATLDLILGVGVRTGWTAPGEGALSCQLGLSVFLMSQNFTMPSPAPGKDTYNIDMHTKLNMQRLCSLQTHVSLHMHACLYGLLLM